MSAEPIAARRAARASWSPRALWRSLKIGVGVLVLTAGGIGGYWGILQYEGNVHTVVSGQLYRAAQPDRADLVSDRQAYGIKSVLNLRGAHHGDSWYDNEVAAAGELGMAHFDYPLSAKRVVTEKQIAELLALVRAAPKPLLIHCKSGADRTGLVSALYRYAESGATAQEADGELTLIYGHFPYLTNRTVAMDESFWAYVRDHNGKR